MDPTQASSAYPRGQVPVYVDLGALSENGVTVVGKLGYLFIFDGSNGVFRQYSKWHEEEYSAAATSLIDEWVSLIEERHRKAIGSGASYLHTVIPEKSSVYPHLMPPGEDNVRTPTRLYAGVSTKLKDEPWYVDALKLFDDEATSDLMWPRTGSHWTPSGARYLAQELVRRLDGTAADAIAAIPFRGSAKVESDLAGHLLGSIPTEWAPAPLDADVPFGRTATKLGGAYETSNKWSHWKCDDALIGKKLLMFGSSSMQVAPLKDRLSWWFCRSFSESRFHWTPDFSEDLLEDYAPDVVITQGSERFMPRVPRA